MNIIWIDEKHYCQCGCGNMTKSGCIYLHGHNRRNKETTKETKILLSKQKLGDKNPAKNPEIKVKIAKKVELLWKTNEYRGNHSNWLGGISKFPYTQDWTDTLKESIRQRDNYKCQLCLISQDELNIKLHVHHKDYDKENCDPNNLISLCHSCHTKTNHNREHWEKFFNQTNIRLIL